MKTPRPLTLWAAVIKSARSEWIDWTSMGWNRRNALDAYRIIYGNINTPTQDERDGLVRFAKVTVAEVARQPRKPAERLDR